MKRIGPQNLRYSISDLARILLCLYFIISIAEPYLNGLVGSLTKYYMFVVMFVFLRRDGFKLKLRTISIVYIIWLCFKILTLLWSESFEIPKLHFISQVGMVLFMVILLSQQSDDKTIKDSLDVYWLSSIVLGVLSIFFSDTYLGENEARQVLVIMGVEVDPNNQAALLLVGVSISLSNILYEKRKIVSSAIGLLINVYACFGTSSRGALVTMLAIMLFCVFYSAEKERKPKTVIYRLAIMLLGVGVIYFLTVSFLPQANIERLFDFESYEGGSERSVLWGIVWDNFTKDPLTVLIGTGWGSAYEYLNGLAVHNTFLTFLSDTGVTGMLLFVIPMAVAALRLLKGKKPAPVLLLAAQMIPAFFIDAINKRFFWNAVIILFLYYYKRPEETNCAS